jgi:hypothetical protein
MPDYFPGEKICQVIEDKLHSESGSKMIERFEANSAFIALVNPDTILKLISVIEESREALSIGQELVSELENEDVDITDIQQHTNEIYELVTVLTKINEILGESE